MMKTLLVLLAGCCFAGAALAQHYRWVDKDGRVQYGDNPPPGVKATPLRGAPAAPPAAAPAAPAAQKPAAKAPASAAEKDADFKKRQEEQAKEKEKEDSAKADADAKKQNCANAQADVRTLEIGRVRRIDSKGEPYYLEDAQIAQEMARAKKGVADWCN